MACGIEVVREPQEEDGVKGRGDEGDEAEKRAWRDGFGQVGASQELPYPSLS